MFGFERIAEDRILTAINNGFFDNIEGKGKPFKQENKYIPDDLRLAYKILKNANYLPPEIELKKEIHRTEDLLSNMPETHEKFNLMKKLNYLIMKYNILSNKSFNSDLPQCYNDKIIQKFENSKKHVMNS